MANAEIFILFASIVVTAYALSKKEDALVLLYVSLPAIFLSAVAIVLKFIEKSL